MTSYSTLSAQVILGSAPDTYNDFCAAELVNVQPLDTAAFEHCGTKLRVPLPGRSVVMLTLTQQ